MRKLLIMLFCVIVLAGCNSNNDKKDDNTKSDVSIENNENNEINNSEDGSVYSNSKSISNK